MKSPKPFKSVLCLCLYVLSGCTTSLQPQFQKSSSVINQAAPEIQEGLAFIKYYDWITCDAKWGEACVGKQPEMVFPPGYQVCTVRYTISEKVSNTIVRYAAMRNFPDDAERPPRFSAVQLLIGALGNQTLHQLGGGSKITLVDVGITSLHDSASNADRKRHNCWMPTTLSSMIGGLEPPKVPE